MGEVEIPVLEARGLSKSFGHVQALVDADLAIYPREIVALVGDNGAGKSTMIKIIAGAYISDRGEILVDGKKVVIRNPQDAHSLGIATVYQDLALADLRDVGANIFLGYEFIRWGGLWVDWAKGRRESEKILRRIGVQLPSMKVDVSRLSGGQRQAVAIGRALVRGGKLIIMDEPTAALGVQESAQILQLVLELREQGASVLMISHNLQHVFSVVDRIVVMRHGRVIGSRLKAKTTMEEIVQMIVGG